MKQRNRLHAVLCAVFAIICLHASANAQSAEDKNKFAALAASGASVRWEVSAPFKALTLTVSAPTGQVFRREFRAGDAPFFALFDNQGKRLPDGQYTYELRLTPNVRAARVRNDEAAPDTDARAPLAAQSLVQSGSFLIQKGTVFAGGDAEPVKQRSGGKAAVAAAAAPNPVPLDQVVPDDMIVQASLCVGFDCVDGESFGTDTIRLKENNTRLKFDDTSTSAGFAANDWQLTANDQPSGGANKFSIDDITGGKTPFTITAGAATNSIFVDSIGRVGFRTSTPALDLSMNTSNTPAIRFEQNNSGGFTAQTWDIGANEANFFVRDVTGGSRLPFRIRPGAPTSSIDIGADGVVKFGTGILLPVTPPGGTTTYVNTVSQLNPLGPAFALHFMGAAGAVDESSASIVDMDNAGGASVRSGSTGTVVIRFNLPVTPNLSALGSAQSVFKVRFRDSDGAGATARVRVFFHHTNIDTGVDSAPVIFDSNTQAATAGNFSTATVCFPTSGSSLSFATQSSWFEIQVTKSDAAALANFLQLQFYRDVECPQ
ncbi:MAG TPA: hypothetical protein VJ715_05605 [Pyrinomonadaceae bacterium]|nr:hypothetical protein [Pyrinomonadaceae bacterium]